MALVVLVGCVTTTSTTTDKSASSISTTLIPPVPLLQYKHLSAKWSGFPQTKKTSLLFFEIQDEYGP